MTALNLVPIVLGLVLLAAHFLRPGNLVAAALSLGLIGLIAVRRPWARRALQVALGLGALLWLQVLAGRVAERRAAGEDWSRLAWILGTVAAFTALAALLLETRRMRERFDRRG